MSFLHAKSIEVSYDVTFSIFGKIGESTVTYETTDSRYKITVVAKTMGMTADLTANRVETYISEGKITEGLLRPDRFVSSKKSDTKVRTKTYRFDHQNKTVMLDINTTRIKNEHSFDIHAMRIIETPKEEVSHSSRPYDYYALDDTLSLFFNTPEYLKSSQKSNTAKVSAIGINKDGKTIDITIATDKREAFLRSLMPVNAQDKLYTIDVSKDVLIEDDAAGELIIGMDEKNMPSAVLMENIAFFGDIKAKKIAENIKL
jgi:hypothetical protein